MEEAKRGLPSRNETQSTPLEEKLCRPGCESGKRNTHHSGFSNSKSYKLTAFAKWQESNHHQHLAVQLHHSSRHISRVADRYLLNFGAPTLYLLPIA
jgi:hypothetical protein